MRESPRFLPHVWRLGVMVPLLVALARAIPTSGPTHITLVVALLSVVLALTMLALLLFSVPFPRRALSFPFSRNAAREASQEKAGLPGPRWQTLVPQRQMSQNATMIALILGVALSVVLNSLTLNGAAVASILLCVSLAVSRLPLRQAITIEVLAAAGLFVAGE